jgi:predicted lipoprotein with Yx(FWY)xxD motif
MSARRLAAAAVLAGAGAVAAVAVAAGSPVTVRAASSASLGKTTLVTAGGLTLYHLKGESAAKITCTGSCAATWPPLVLAKGAKVRAGAGVSAAALGVVRRPDGKRQVTYAGLPLYRFAADAKAGDAKGEGAGGKWFAVAPAGAAAPAPAPPATTTTTDDGGYYPY